MLVSALERRDEIIHDLHDDAPVPWLEDKGIELVRGGARPAGELMGGGVVGVSKARRRAGEVNAEANA